MIMLSYNRNFHIHAKQQVVIIWSPKAACTTVNYMYFEHENLLKEVKKTTKWIHYYRQLYQRRDEILRDYAIHNFNNARYVQFCVNPYRRAVSSYVHGMKNCYISDDNKNISFLEFLTRIKLNKIKPNVHHNKQTFFKNNYKQINVVKMENFTNDIKSINKKFKLHYKPYAKQNVRNKSTKITTFVGNSIWNSIKNNIPSDYTLFYNNAIKKLVEQIYYEDLINLGYTWDMFVKYEQNN